MGIRFRRIVPPRSPASGSGHTSPLSATGKVASLITYQIAATNNPTSFSATNLPQGLVLNSSTGIISGTPSATGTFISTISAVNLGGTGSATFTIVILPLIPVITSANSATGVAGTAFSYQITASNNPTGFGATGLPAGLTVDPVAGLISGTLEASGTFVITLNATNSGGTGTVTLRLPITANLALVVGSYDGLGS